MLLWSWKNLIQRTLDILRFKNIIYPCSSKTLLTILFWFLNLFVLFQLWQLETLLLQRDTYMNYSRPLSTTSAGVSTPRRHLIKPRHVVRKCRKKLQYLILDNWQRSWVLLLWIMLMAILFVWKFLEYREKAAFKVMGYCLTTAKGAAETLKLNMALVLLPVCRNTLTWLRSTRARACVPFDDNINFHKVKYYTTIHISFYFSFFIDTKLEIKTLCLSVVPFLC